MKQWLTMGLLLGLAGCGQPTEQTPAGQPATNKQETALSNVVDVVTQRRAIEAGQRAAATIRQVSTQENQRLKEVEVP